jgi:hypothetical protein
MHDNGWQKVVQPMSSHAYICKITGVGMTCQEIGAEKIVCNLCGSQVCQKIYQGTIKCSNQLKTYCSPIAMVPSEPKPKHQTLVEPYCISVSGHERKQCPLYQ